MNITKHKNYYYLAHSFREEGKVVHREKYLGKVIPKNIEKIKETFFQECLQEDLIKKLKIIKKNFQKEWKHYPKSVKKEVLLDFSIEFTYNTNAIEGSTITLEEAREIIHDKIAPNKPLRDVKETELHSKVFLQMLNKKEKMSNKLILKWHKDIFRETKQDIAGKFRKYPVRVGNYIAPHWKEVKPSMNKLIEFVNKSKLNPVELVARAHYKFESIHPFGDGNGRIGRYDSAAAVITCKKIFHPWYQLRFIHIFY